MICLFVYVTPGETLSDAFGTSWLRLAYDGINYSPFDMNMPPRIPRRLPSVIAMDPPLTEHGEVVSQLTGKALRLAEIRPFLIVSGPEYRCVQTAAGLIKALDSPCYICVEEGLQSWMQLTGSSPLEALQPRDLSQLDLPVIESYQSFFKRDKIRSSESFCSFVARIHAVNNHLLHNFESPIIMVADAAVTLLAQGQVNFSRPQELLTARSKTPPCSVETFECVEKDSLKPIKNLMMSVTPTYVQKELEKTE